MGLFFDVLSSINNPNQNGSVDQLSTIMNTVQQAAATTGVEPSTVQTVLSGLGGALRPALQQQASGGGMGNLVGQLAGMAGGASAMGGLSSLLSPQLQEQLIQGVTQKTGVNAGVVQSLLPTLLPAVMQLLNMGGSKTGGLTGNPLLQSFLDGDRDQDVDLGDVFHFANRFLNPPR
ncbi:MAG: DUF937 domain-containing protein [Elainella sp. Prado103]|nr:DUF937 domain-containing protein [Elainella sp. Prado103]